MTQDNTKEDNTQCEIINTVLEQKWLEPKWSRAGAQETCSHDENKAGWEREVEAEWQGGKVQEDGQHCTPEGDPLLGWKHGVRAKGTQGVKEVGRQLRVPCDEPRFEEPRVER